MVDTCIKGVLLTFAFFHFVLPCFLVCICFLPALYLYSLGLVMLRMHEKKKEGKTLEKERRCICELDLDT